MPPWLPAYWWPRPAKMRGLSPLRLAAAAVSRHPPPRPIRPPATSGRGRPRRCSSALPEATSGGESPSPGGRPPSTGDGAGEAPRRWGTASVPCTSAWRSARRRRVPRTRLPTRRPVSALRPIPACLPARDSPAPPRRRRRRPGPDGRWRAADAQMLSSPLCCAPEYERPRPYSDAPRWPDPTAPSGVRRPPPLLRRGRRRRLRCGRRRLR